VEHKKGKSKTNIHFGPKKASHTGL